MSVCAGGATAHGPFAPKVVPFSASLFHAIDHTPYCPPGHHHPGGAADQAAREKAQSRSLRPAVSEPAQGHRSKKPIAAEPDPKHKPAPATKPNAVVEAAKPPIARIQTSHGQVLQDSSPEALAARTAVEQGRTLYRLVVQQTIESDVVQHWSFKNPITSEVPQSNRPQSEILAKAKFLEMGRLKSGALFVTRLTSDTDGKGVGIEVITIPEAVQCERFELSPRS
jgi:hypothetical protein